MSIIKVNFTKIANDNMRKRINTLHNVLHDAYYLRNIIGPQLKEIVDKVAAGSECDLIQWCSYAQGSYLTHFPEIRSYTVVRHCFIPDQGNIYVIAIDKDALYGFLIDKYGWAQYGIFKESDYKQFQQCESSEYIGRTIGDIADQFRTPPVEAFSKLYKMLYQ